MDESGTEASYSLMVDGWRRRLQDSRDLFVFLLRSTRSKILASSVSI